MDPWLIDFGWLIGSVIFGIFLGCLTGLIPGFHVNNVALIALSLSPVAVGIGIPLDAVAGIIVACGTVHTFLNYIPSALVGAPDDNMALALLPGHRMLISGQAAQGVAYSARGSQMGMLMSNPRPEIIGTFSPQAARAGAKMIETLSPTPPVECLSTTRWLQSLGQAKTFPESLIALVRKIVEFSSSPFSNISLNQSMTPSSLSEPSTTPFTISAIESLMPHPRRIHRVILRYSFPCPIGIEPDFGQDFRSQNHLEQSAHVLRHLYLLSTPWCPRMYHRIECL